MLNLLFVFIVMTPCLTYVLFNMIQEGQLLGGWQRVLDKVYAKNRFLAMFLGDCDKCFSNFIAHVTLFIYLIIQYNNDFWGWWDILLYFTYVPLNIVLSVFILTYSRYLGLLAKEKEKL